MEINQLETVPNEVLATLCSKMDLWELLDFNETYPRSKLVCDHILMKEIEKSKTIWERAFFSSHVIICYKNFEDLQVEIELKPYLNQRRDRIQITQSITKSNTQPNTKSVNKHDVQKIEWPIVSIPPDKEVYTKDLYYRYLTENDGNVDLMELFDFLIEDGYRIEISP